MVTELSISHCNELVVVCCCRNIGAADCIVYSKLSINKSGGCQSSEESENGVIKKSSRARATKISSPHPLTEPYVNLSIHTALQHHVTRTVTGWEKLFPDCSGWQICLDAGLPFATSDFRRTLNTTTGASAPVEKWTFIKGIRQFARPFHTLMCNKELYFYPQVLLFRDQAQ